MINFFNDDIIDSDNCPLEDKVCEKFVDIHCHCLPGVDDGPASISEALMLCRALVAEGVVKVVATPHQLGRFEGRNDSNNVRKAVRSLNNLLRERGVSIEIVPGGEVRVDERICRLLKDDKILTLADGGKYILLELPHDVFINIEPLIRELVFAGIRPIISHAERISALTREPDALLKWLGCSAVFQITASSLLGDFGSKAEKTSWDFLTHGYAKFVASDSHNTHSRKPNIRDAFGRIEKKLGKDIARIVCFENPLRVINGLDIISYSHHKLQEKE